MSARYHFSSICRQGTRRSFPTRCVITSFLRQHSIIANHQESRINDSGTPSIDTPLLDPPQFSTFYSPSAADVMSFPIATDEFSAAFAKLPLHQILNKQSAPELFLQPRGAVVSVPICVAVSGGVDSMASALLLTRYCAQHNQQVIQSLVDSTDTADPATTPILNKFTPHPYLDSLPVRVLLVPVAATVDHSLREPSKYETQFVRESLQEHGIPTMTAVLCWNTLSSVETVPIVAEMAPSIFVCSAVSPSPASARLLRYSALKYICANVHALFPDLDVSLRSVIPSHIPVYTLTWAPALITGHHAGDQAETVCMRFLRGSGPAGLAGMDAAVPLAGLGEPLLPTTCTDRIELVCAAQVSTSTTSSLALAERLLLCRPLLGEPKTRLAATYVALASRERDIPDNNSEKKSETPSIPVGWVVDPTNVDEHYDRARARHALEHLRERMCAHLSMESVAESGADIGARSRTRTADMVLAGALRHLRRQAEMSDTVLESMLRKSCVVTSFGTVTMRLPLVHNPIDNMGMSKDTCTVRGWLLDLMLARACAVVADLQFQSPLDKVMAVRRHMLDEAGLSFIDLPPHSTYADAHTNPQTDAHASPLTPTQVVGAAATATGAGASACLDTHNQSQVSLISAHSPPHTHVPHPSNPTRPRKARPPPSERRWWRLGTCRLRILGEGADACVYICREPVPARTLAMPYDTLSENAGSISGTQELHESENIRSDPSQSKESNLGNGFAVRKSGASSPVWQVERWRVAVSTDATSAAYACNVSTLMHAQRQWTEAHVNAVVRVALGMQRGLETYVDVSEPVLETCVPSASAASISNEAQSETPSPTPFSVNASTEKKDGSEDEVSTLRTHTSALGVALSEEEAIRRLQIAKRWRRCLLRSAQEDGGADVEVTVLTGEETTMKAQMDGTAEMIAMHDKVTGKAVMTHMAFEPMRARRWAWWGMWGVGNTNNTIPGIHSFPKINM